MIEIKNVNEFDNVIEGVVDFSATWCGPCRMLRPVLEKVEKDYDVPFYSVDVDDVEELAIRFGVSSIPCVIYIKNKEEQDRFVGFVPEAHIRKFVEVNK